MKAALCMLSITAASKNDFACVLCTVKKTRLERWGKERAAAELRLHSWQEGAPGIGAGKYLMRVWYIHEQYVEEMNINKQRLLEACSYPEQKGWGQRTKRDRRTLWDLATAKQQQTFIAGKCQKMSMEIFRPLMIILKKKSFCGHNWQYYEESSVLRNGQKQK